MLRRLRSGSLFAGLFASVAGFANQVLAQAAQDVADDRAQGFQAVSGAVKEDVAGGPLMLAAYAVVWLCVFVYVFRLVRLQRNVEDNLSRLERSLVGSGQPERGAR